MKRSVILIMILGLISGSVVTAEAKQAGGKRLERTVEGSYATQFVPPYMIETRKRPASRSLSIGVSTSFW